MPPVSPDVFWPLVLDALGIFGGIVGTLTMLLYKSQVRRLDALEKAREAHDKLLSSSLSKDDVRMMRSDLLDVMTRFEAAIGDRVKDLERVQEESAKQITELRILQAQCGRCGPTAQHPHT